MGVWFQPLFTDDDFSGSNNIYSEVASGGALLGGSAEVSASYSPASAGGVLVAGSAANSANYSPSSSGGVLCDGSAANNTAFNPAISGGVVIDGSILTQAIYSPGSSGGVLVDGDFEIEFDSPTNTIEEALRVLLGAVEGLSIQSVSIPVYPLRIPQGATLPAISYRKVSKQPVHTLKGAGGVSQDRFQFDVWGNTAAQIFENAEDVRLSLDGFSGFVGTVEILCITLRNMIDLGEPPKHADDDWKFRRSLDFFVMYREEIPTFDD